MRYLLFFLLSCPVAAMAQDTIHHVIGNAGDHFPGTSLQVSWTIGELSTETLQSSNYIVSQGFHQGKLMLDRIKENFPLDFSILVYPNPVKDILIIKSEQSGLDYQVLDVKGRILLTGTIYTESSRIDFTRLPAGTYFLQVNSHKTHQIIKP